jgi:hypothetical protein
VGEELRPIHHQDQHQGVDVEAVEEVEEEVEVRRSRRKRKSISRMVEQLTSCP